MLPACTDMKQLGLITLVYNSIHRLPTGVRRSAVMATNHQNECQRSTFMKNHRCVKKFLDVASLCLFQLNFLFLSLLLCLGLSTKTFCLGLENNFIWLKIAVSVATKWLEMSPGRFKTRPGLVYLKTVKVGPLSCEKNSFSRHKNCWNCLAFLLALAKTQHHNGVLLPSIVLLPMFFLTVISTCILNQYCADVPLVSRFQSSYLVCWDTSRFLNSFHF